MRFIVPAIFVICMLTACTDLTEANRQYREAMILLKKGTEEALQRGRDALTLAAEAGSPDAALTLGYYHLKGEFGFVEDAERALRLFLQAANAGNRDGAYNAGLSYLRGNGTEIDMEQAFRWFEKAAYQGDPGAQYNTGLMKLKGDGTVLDPLMAAVWFYLADQKGYEGAKEAGRAARRSLTDEQEEEFDNLLERTQSKIREPVPETQTESADANAPL